MSLIICPECGKKFSDKAKVCPNCAFPIDEIIKNKTIKEDFSNANNTSKKNNILAILIIIIILIVGIFITYYNYNSLKAEEKIAYELIDKNKNKFKNPSSLKVLEITLYGKNYALVNIEGNNSFGSPVSSNYIIKDDVLYEVDDTNPTIKQLAREIFEVQKSSTNKVIKFNSNSINKINRKLK